MEACSLFQPLAETSPHALPEELVEVPVLHVLKDHDERVALHADTIELDDVLVLEVGQQLRLTVEVLARIVTGVLQRLGTGVGREGRKSIHLKPRMSKGRLSVEKE